jgi:protoporphyrinogen oxidase
MPGCNWTGVLCDGVTELLIRTGVRIRTSTTVTALKGTEGQITDVELQHGERLSADFIVSAVPTEIYRTLLAEDSTPALADVRYTAAVSVICAAKLPIPLPFYWLNLASPRCNASAIFVLNSLNSTIGEPGESCLNFVTHLQSRRSPFFRRSDDELLDGYQADFQAVFRTGLSPNWVHVARIPLYSPILVRGYRNPPVRSSTWRNVYFAGNCRTFPSIVSTGTALLSGLEAAETLLRQHGVNDGNLLSTARDFQPVHGSR